MKYIITQAQCDAILGMPGYKNLKDSLREINPIEPMSADEIWRSDEIMAINSDIGASMGMLTQLVRSI